MFCFCVGVVCFFLGGRGGVVITSVASQVGGEYQNQELTDLNDDT